MIQSLTLEASKMKRVIEKLGNENDTFKLAQQSRKEISGDPVVPEEETDEKIDSAA